MRILHTINRKSATSGCTFSLTLSLMLLAIVFPIQFFLNNFCQLRIPPEVPVFNFFYIFFIKIIHLINKFIYLHVYIITPAFVVVFTLFTIKDKVFLKKLQKIIFFCKVIFKTHLYTDLLIFRSKLEKK